MRVLDAAGRLLESKGVHYRWASGAPVSVSPSGVVTVFEPVPSRDGLRPDQRFVAAPAARRLTDASGWGNLFTLDSSRPTS
jgi:hypothetical protein